LWKEWFDAAGLRVNVRTVAEFNDAGLMLQATEQNLGLALSRELLAADALCDGRLVQLSPIFIMHAEAQPYHLVYPPNLRDWPPLRMFRDWLFEQIAVSLKMLRASRRGGVVARQERRKPHHRKRVPRAIDK
jgi:LysR family glycine cleavage system transcriptional activator